MKQYTYHISRPDELDTVITALKADCGSLNCERSLMIVYLGIPDNRKKTEIMAELSGQFPGMTILGVSQFGPILKTVHMPMHIDLSVITFAESSFHVFLYDRNEMSEAEGAADLGRKLNAIGYPKGIYCVSAGDHTDPDRFLDAIAPKWNDLPVFGIQAAAYVKGQEDPTLFVNGKCMTDVILAVVFAGKSLQVHAGFTLGWKPVGRQMMITDSDGQYLVRKIDDITPHELYKRYLHLENDPDYYESCAFPLLVGGSDSKTARVSVDQQKDGFVFNAPMPIGSHLTFSYATEKHLLVRSLRIANWINSKDPQALFSIACQNRRIFLGNALSDHENDYARQILPTVLTGNGYGEILRLRGHGGLRSNTIVLCSMREGESTTPRPELKDPYLDTMQVCTPKLNSMIVNFLEETTKDMQDMAAHDFMTRLYNRAAMEQWVRSLNHEPLAAFLFDVDHFKRTNDTFGHDTGDMVLSTTFPTSETIQNGLTITKG